MSLRSRLILIVLGLVAGGLVTALGATAGALQDWKGDQDNDVLTVVGRRLAADLREKPEGSRQFTDDIDSDEIGQVWRDLAADGDTPSFFQLRSRDGKTLQTMSFGSVPNIGDPLPKNYWPIESSEDNPDGERFARTASALENGAAGAPNWLIRTSRITEDGDILVVGVPTTKTDELLSRTMTVAYVSGAVAFIAVGLLSLYAIRRGLRPLEKIADTARGIGSGDLGRRVPEAKPGTEIGTLSDALNAMLGQVESAFAARQESENRLRRFVADASHELRTPIATIRGYAELFRRGAATRPDDLAKAMRRIESEAQRMGILVDELLLLAQLDQGRPLERQPVDLTKLAADAVTDTLATEPGRNIHLDAGDPVVVTGDPTRLRQLFGNLLSNVLQHTPSTAVATVRVYQIDKDAVIEVADTGPGMSEQDRALVFERFFRAPTPRPSDNGGAGLGLAIVAAIAKAHAGTATASSQLGVGTTFRIVLPAGGH